MVKLNLQEDLVERLDHTESKKHSNQRGSIISIYESGLALKEFLTRNKDQLHTAIDHTMLKKWGSPESTYVTYVT